MRIVFGKMEGRRERGKEEGMEGGTPYPLPMR